MNDHKRLKICQLSMKKMEGTLSSEEARSLHEQLDANQEALDLYVDLAIMCSTLSQSGDVAIAPVLQDTASDRLDKLLDELSQAEKEAAPLFLEEVKDVKQELIQHVERPRSPRRISKTTIVSFALSAAAIILLALFVRFAPVNSHNPVSLATLSRSVNARWMDPSGMIADGCDLYAGPLHLAKGYAEVYTENDSQIILQAPVQLELESASQMRLSRGRVTVKVKTGENSYVVRTPTASVVDLGTEFGVYVNEQNDTLTHVYEGQVELRSGTDPLRPQHVLKLTKSQSGQVNASGQLSEKLKVENLFVRSEEFNVKFAASKGSSYQRWLAYSYQLRRDPDLVLYYPFLKSDASQDDFSNYAMSTKEDHLSATLGGTFGLSNFTPPSSATGRWPNKAALKFNRTQRNCLSVAESDKLMLVENITLAAWVRCPDTQKGGHLLSNRVEGSINYQFACFSQDDPYYANQLQFLRTDDSFAKMVYSSRRYEWTSEWTFLAVTHDTEMVHFYVNGELFESIPFISKKQAVPARLFIGDVPMGGGKTFGYAAFNGLIDEIAIFKRVFSSEEIMKMYEAGRP